MLIFDHWFHVVFIRQSSGRKRKILEKSKKSKNKVEIMFTFELRITLCVCVYVRVCVDYICVFLCVVVYMFVTMCVYDDTCVGKQICSCLLNICVAMCSGSHVTFRDLAE